jgi:hypothetical protein
MRSESANVPSSSRIIIPRQYSDALLASSDRNVTFTSCIIFICGFAGALVLMKHLHFSWLTEKALLLLAAVCGCLLALPFSPRVRIYSDGMTFERAWVRRYVSYDEILSFGVVTNEMHDVSGAFVRNYSYKCTSARFTFCLQPNRHMLRCTFTYKRGDLTDESVQELIKVLTRRISSEMLQQLKRGESVSWGGGGRSYRSKD